MTRTWLLSAHNQNNDKYRFGANNEKCLNRLDSVGTLAEASFSRTDANFGGCTETAALPPPLSNARSLSRKTATTSFGPNPGPERSPARGLLEKGARNSRHNSLGSNTRSGLFSNVYLFLRQQICKNRESPIDKYLKEMRWSDTLKIPNFMVRLRLFSIIITRRQVPQTCARNLCFSGRMSFSKSFIF